MLRCYHKAYYFLFLKTFYLSTQDTETHAFFSTQILSSGYNLTLKEVCSGDFPGGPVANTVLPVPEAWFQSLVRELDPTCHK